MKLSKPEIGDFWGGLAAMLVALPSAIAFGVTIYSPLGASYIAQGALAGILGVTALGLIAPALGGTNRLISAPCAPAAAVTSAFALNLMSSGSSIESALLMISILGLLAGLLQILFGTIRLGQLIQYMPYPVVSGYLSGVGLYIIAGQVPRLLGAPKDMHFWHSLASPEIWQWQSMLVGIVTIAAMLFASKITQAIPAAILALLAGVLAYFGLSLIDPALLSLENNSFVVGKFNSGGNFSEAINGRWQAMSLIGLNEFKLILFPALTLAVLLSIDTLKTCVVLDALTRSRHLSNRELIGQGCANIVSAIIGGVPGAGTMGATLVNMSSGAVTRYSGIIEGFLALIAFLILGSLISWIPVASLAAILIVIGVRMIDKNSFHFLKQTSTMLDFAVIAVVVVTALTVSLIAASGIGIILSMLLFIRAQIGGNIVRRKVYCNQIFSKRIRPLDEMKILTERGERGVVVELQGSLFFGTTNQLYKVLEPELKTHDFVILDMRRVQSVDVTAVHMLDQIKDMLAERKGYLIFSQLPKHLPSGQNMQKYFDQVGLVRAQNPVLVVGELDEALEWLEERNLADARRDSGEQKSLSIGEFDIFKDSSAETLASLEQIMHKKTYKTGEIIFRRGDTGDEIFLIRSGSVRIMLPLSEQQSHHLGTFGRGSFFGEMAFLDGESRSADALAVHDTEVYILSRKTFETIVEKHKGLALGLMAGLATVIATRLRYTNTELRVLED